MLIGLTIHRPTYHKNKQISLFQATPKGKTYLWDSTLGAMSKSTSPFIMGRFKYIQPVGAHPENMCILEEQQQHGRMKE